MFVVHAAVAGGGGSRGALEPAGWTLGPHGQHTFIFRISSRLFTSGTWSTLLCRSCVTLRRIASARAEGGVLALGAVCAACGRLRVVTRCELQGAAHDLGPGPASRRGSGLCTLRVELAGRSMGVGSILGMF
jgi:hypothetical protein